MKDGCFFFLFLFPFSLLMSAGRNLFSAKKQESLFFFFRGEKRGQGTYMGGLNGGLLEELGDDCPCLYSIVHAYRLFSLDMIIFYFTT